MHELSLTRNIVAIVAEHAKDRPVRRVRVAIGPRAGVERQALAFCFDIVASGTVLQGAQLEFLDAEGDRFVIQDYELQEAA
jgi:hydrogenase nickel incorporation protein HypA/HybF